MPHTRPPDTQTQREARANAREGNARARPGRAPRRARRPRTSTGSDREPKAETKSDAYATPGLRHPSRTKTGEGLPRRRRRNTAGMLPRTTPRAIMKPKLKQLGTLQVQKGPRHMDPDPLADALHRRPLPRNTELDEQQNLLRRQGPMAQMERPPERAGQPHGPNPVRKRGRRTEGGGRTRRTGRRGRRTGNGGLNRTRLGRTSYAGGRTRYRLMNCSIFLFHNFFKIRSNTAPQQNLMASLRGASSVFVPRQEGAFLGKVERRGRHRPGATARNASWTLPRKAPSVQYRP